MTRLAHPLRTLIKVLHDEGWRAARDRLHDVLQVAREHRRHPVRRLLEATTGADFLSASVLNVSPVSPFPRRGGAQLQMLDRLQAEAASRPVALLFPVDGHWQLDLASGSDRQRWLIAGLPDTTPLESAVAAVERTAALCGASGIHLENPAGLPLELGLTLRERGHRLLLSLHDFVCFCRRPHLIDAAAGEFCDFCRNDARCRSCFACTEEKLEIPQTEYRRRGSSLLAAADALVFPSEYLREKYRTLFPGNFTARRETVISPSTARPSLAPRHQSPEPRLALVGGAKAHKGGLISGEMLRSLRREHPRLAVSLYGDGDPEPLRQLRDAGVRIRGYYRAGHLPSLLRKDGITAAVLPSIWPESYALVVDECLHAGVPVAAFDLGAVGPRLRELAGGLLAAPESGAAGLATAVSKLLRDHTTASDSVALSLPTPADSARAMIQLYTELELC